MPDYTYEALGKAGDRNSGTLTATSEREAALMLDARGLFPVRIAQAKSKGIGGSSKRVKGRVISAFYAQLADLLQSGVPLLKSLDILEKQTSHQGLAFALREVRARVADGTTLADAMRPFPNVFNELAVSMVRAGQEGGFLEDVLRRIADFTEHQEDLKAKVVGSMAYPVLLGVIGFIILNVLVIFFVPKFEPIFERLKAKGELPALTTFIIGLSHFILDNWWWMIPLAATAIFGFVWWKRSESGRITFDRIKMRIPVAGELVMWLAIGRLTLILCTIVAIRL